MSKAFLSHNSFDKDFVEEVFNKLGGGRAVYDAETFKTCCDLPAQIRNGLENCDVYVLFLSKASVESGWVKAEQDLAHELQSRWQLKSVLIFQLDSTGWEYLPKWATKYVVSCPPSPEHVALRIRDELRKEPSEVQICYGRDEEIKSLNLKILELDETPTHILLSGPTGIGRKTLVNSLYATLYKHVSSFKISVSYGENDDIYALYRRLLGHSAHWRARELIDKVSEFTCLSDRDQVIVLGDLITSITTEFDQVLFIDVGSNAFGSDGRPLGWLATLLSILEPKGYPYLVILSNRHYPDSSGVIHQVKPLDEENSRYLFKILLAQNSIVFPSPQERKLVENSIIGHPGLINAVVNYLRLNPRYRPNRTHTSILQIINMQVEKMLVDFIRHNPHHEKAVALFGDAFILSYAEIVSLMTHWPDLEESVDQLLNAGFLSVTNSYYQLAPYLQRYAQRLSERLTTEMVEVRKILLNDSEGYDENSYVSIELLDSRIIEHLVSGTPIPGFMSGLVMPAQQIKASKREYDLRNYKSSLSLAMEAYSQTSKLSQSGLVESWRLLGLSSARIPDEEGIVYFNSEAPRLPETDRKKATYHFVHGLKARLQGNLREALPCFVNCYDVGDADSHVCRELAYIHAFEGELDKAQDYIREARRLAPSNPYILDVEAFILLERYRARRDPLLLDELDNCIARLEEADIRENKKFSQIRISMRDILTNEGADSLRRIFAERSYLPVHAKISLLGILSTKGKTEQYTQLLAEIKEALRSKPNKMAEIELAKMQITHLAYNNQHGEAQSLLSRHRRKFTEHGANALTKLILEVQAVLSTK
ncbi:TIR domain-containing protein [Pseudomonas brassicacearum]|uniref:TIR domain-containing protein n=1 Tax=Pseudomonas brassicacearum TaxID=930166 RepID=UPI000418A41A|nr:TIR domain-containing protein [Pseudomonas brassicacearum]UVM45599.1 TIR domain-containing protein [Pseudomonas brassicacearum]